MQVRYITKKYTWKIVLGGLDYYYKNGTSSCGAILKQKVRGGIGIFEQAKYTNGTKAIKIDNRVKAVCNCHSDISHGVCNTLKFPDICYKEVFEIIT